MLPELLEAEQRRRVGGVAEGVAGRLVDRARPGPRWSGRARHRRGSGGSRSPSRAWRSLLGSAAGSGRAARGIHGDKPDLFSQLLPRRREPAATERGRGASACPGAGPQLTRTLWAPASPARAVDHMELHDLPTPALVVDAGAFAHNVVVMGRAWPGRSLRPHVKAFKSTALARELARAGHPGFCAATPREILGLAAAGLGEDLLLANECVDPARLAAMARAGARVTVAVDSPATVDAAASAGIEEVLIDVDVGCLRCGCDRADAGRLADAARARGLGVRGVMGYEGHLMMEPAASKETLVAEAMGRAGRGQRRGRRRRGLGRRDRHLRRQPVGDRAAGRLVHPDGHRLRPPGAPLPPSPVGVVHGDLGPPHLRRLGGGRRGTQGAGHGPRRPGRGRPRRWSTAPTSTRPSPPPRVARCRRWGTGCACSRPTSTRRWRTTSGCTWSTGRMCSTAGTSTCATGEPSPSVTTALGAGTGDGMATPVTTTDDLGTGAAPGLEMKRGGLGSPAQAVALATLCAVLFLTFLDNTIVSVGLANIQSDLHASVASLQWVVNGYALTFAAFMLAAGYPGRPARSQADHAGRGRRLLRRVGGGRPGAERRLADRGPGRHGSRVRRPLSRGPCRSSATSTPTRRPGPTPSGCGRRSPGWPWPSAPSSAGCWSGIAELAGHLLVQPVRRGRGLRHGPGLRARDIGPPGSAHRRGRDSSSGP